MHRVLGLSAKRTGAQAMLLRRAQRQVALSSPMGGISTAAAGKAAGKAAATAAADPSVVPPLSTSENTTTSANTSKKEPQWLERTITIADSKQRLDRYLRSEFNLPQSLVEKLLRKQYVLVNGQRGVDNDYKIGKGDLIKLPLGIKLRPIDKSDRTSYIDVTEEDRAMLHKSVLYTDNDLFVLNKPFGVATQGGRKITRHIDGMLHVLKSDKDPDEERPKLVHRLDKDTTGCLLIARSRASAARLQEFIRDPKRMIKTYWAFLLGVPKHSQGRINHPIKRAVTHDYERMMLASLEEAASTV